MERKDEGEKSYQRHDERPMDGYIRYGLYTDATEMICKRCHIDKVESDFYTAKSNKTGLTGSCKECIKKQTTNRYYKCKEEDPEKWRGIMDGCLEYNRNHKKQRKSTNHKYNNKRESKDKRNLQRKGKRDTDVNYKITELLRGRVGRSILLKRGYRSEKTKELIGCSAEFIKHHIESQFTEGMSWENHGIFGWHIDHILPIDSFDLGDEEQIKKCFHWTNLQPLWAEDNWRKGNKILVA